jgi:hypothetical protein
MMYNHNLSDLNDRVEDRDVENSVLRTATCVPNDRDVACVQAEDFFGVYALVHARHLAFVLV